MTLVMLATYPEVFADALSFLATPPAAPGAAGRQLIALDDRLWHRRDTPKSPGDVIFLGKAGMADL